MTLTLSQVLSSDQLPSLPAVALRVLELAREPDSDIRQMVATIKSDPALVARILRMANSSMFGLRQRVTAIEQAVPLLGTLTVSSLVLGFSIAAQSVQPGPTSGYYQAVWRGSLLQAVAADTICRQMRLGIPAEFFVAGLLQDIGMLAILRCSSDPYIALLQQVAEQPHCTIVDIEQKKLGFTHARVSSELCRRWKLAEPVCRAIAVHHASSIEADPRDPAGSRLSVALVTASAISDYFLRELKHQSRSVVENLMKQHYGLEGDAVHALLGKIEVNMREAADLFSVDLAELPPYDEILARANAELADIAVRAQLASVEAGVKVQAVQQELHALANQVCRDAMTGLYNRAFFEEMLERECTRCSRYGGALGLIFIDLDHFKRLNDTYGHLFGDEVLRETVRSVLASVRESDTVARFGGEEFVVILPNVTDTALQAIAERIRGAIESLRVSLHGVVIPITASLGATFYQPSTSAPFSSAEIVGMADQAMYEAKRRGRNQVKHVALA